MMTNSKMTNYSAKFQEFTLFDNLDSSIIDELSKISNEVSLGQGETLLRYNTIETHSFLLIEGMIRLLAKNPIEDELFTVGIAVPGQLIGFIDVLRQDSCETAIAKENSRLIAIPNNKLVELYIKKKELRERLDSLESPCEDAKILAMIFAEQNPTPKDGKEWIINQIKTNKEKQNREIGIKLLSSKVIGFEHLIGQRIKNDTKSEIALANKLTTRYINWNEGEEIEAKERTGNIKGYKETERWLPDKSLDLEAFGLKETRDEKELYGFKIVKGKGKIGVHLATLRMIANAYGTPCPIDVIERVLEGAIERGSSVPIQGMGQLAESMGLQTQVGKIRFRHINKLELPVMIKRNSNFSLIANVTNENIVLADPELLVKLNIEQAQKNGEKKLK